ncbi:MAG: sulfatase-like hydrolase/transferase [Candidatus Nanohaloarchaea archaeon]
MSKNVVLLIMDTARAQNFSCYGYEKETTPFIDSVAENGVIFKNCYANAPWTLPSHYSFFTGELPPVHGYTSKDKKSSYDRATLPERLSKRGYRTIGISNNGYISSLYGFDEYFDEFHFNADEAGIDYKLLFENDEIFYDLVEGEREEKWSNAKEKYKYFLKRVAREKSSKSLVNGFYYFVNNKLGSSEEKDDGAEKSNKIALQSIDEEPFFLFINYVEPHTPYNPPDEYALEFLNEKELERARKLSKIDSLKHLKEEKERDDDARLLEMLYNAEIKYLDQKIKELVNQIEEKADDETVFIIASDHGEYFGERGLWEHMGELGEEVLNVPLVIKNYGCYQEEKIFPLRNLFDVLPQISNSDEINSEYGKFLSHYSGLDSHQWRINPDEFPERFLEQQYYFGREGVREYFNKLENIPDDEVRKDLELAKKNSDFDLIEEF